MVLFGEDIRNDGQREDTGFCYDDGRLLQERIVLHSPEALLS